MSTVWEYGCGFTTDFYGVKDILMTYENTIILLGNIISTSTLHSTGLMRVNGKV